MRVRFLTPVIAAIATVVLLASGCGAMTVSKGQLEEQIKTRLTNQAGQSPDKIECPGDLEGKVGATLRCILTAAETKIGLTVTVTSVEGSNVKFDIKVDDKAMS